MVASLIRLTFPSDSSALIRAGVKRFDPGWSGVFFWAGVEKSALIQGGVEHEPGNNVSRYWIRVSYANERSILHDFPPW